jgi:hypothetical protein
MMQTGEISETLVFSSTPTRLADRPGFSRFIRRKNFKSCKSEMLPVELTLF